MKVCQLSAKLVGGILMCLEHTGNVAKLGFDKEIRQ